MRAMSGAFPDFTMRETSRSMSAHGRSCTSTLMSGLASVKSDVTLSQKALELVDWLSPYSAATRRRTPLSPAPASEPHPASGISSPSTVAAAAVRKIIRCTGVFP